MTSESKIGGNAGLINTGYLPCGRTESGFDRAISWQPSRRGCVAGIVVANAPERQCLHRPSTLCRLTSMGRQGRDVRMSLQTLKVLGAFLQNPSDELSGADVMQRGQLASGTLYPILLRLESAGWFVSRWEAIDPSSAGRPRRRFYRLTPTGLRRAGEVFADFGRGVLA